jgi:hypothetical protein
MRPLSDREPIACVCSHGPRELEIRIGRERRQSSRISIKYNLGMPTGLGTWACDLTEHLQVIQVTLGEPGRNRASPAEQDRQRTRCPRSKGAPSPHHHRRCRHDPFAERLLLSARRICSQQATDRHQRGEDRHHEKTSISIGHQVLPVSGRWSMGAPWELGILDDHCGFILVRAPQRRPSRCKTLSPWVPPRVLRLTWLFTVGNVGRQTCLKSACLKHAMVPHACRGNLDGAKWRPGPGEVCECGAPKRRAREPPCSSGPPWDNLMSHRDTGGASADPPGYHPCTSAAGSATPAPGAP